MRKVDKAERTKMVKAMEFICRQINDEDILEGWLMNGVADGDIEYGDLSDDPVDDYWTENENFKDLMRVFTACMARANKSGGLYCDGIVSE